MLENRKFRIPFRYDVEDEIFIICMSEIEEFPVYITKFSDIENKMKAESFHKISRI